MEDCIHDNPYPIQIFREFWLTFFFLNAWIAWENDSRCIDNSTLCLLGMRVVSSWQKLEGKHYIIFNMLFFSIILLVDKFYPRRNVLLKPSHPWQNYHILNPLAGFYPSIDGFSFCWSCKSISGLSFDFVEGYVRLWGCLGPLSWCNRSCHSVSMRFFLSLLCFFFVCLFSIESKSQLKVLATDDWVWIAVY